LFFSRFTHRKTVLRGDAEMLRKTKHTVKTESAEVAEGAEERLGQ